MPSLPARADHVAVEPVVWAADAGDLGGVGFMGCAIFQDNSDQYCFVARQERAPDGAIRARFVTGFYRGDPALGIVDPVVYEDLVDASALTLEHGFVLRVQAELSFGTVDLEMVGRGLSRSNGNEECIDYALEAELASSDPVISTGMETTGTIAGRPIYDLGYDCGSYWIGQTYGAWAMTSTPFT